MTFYRIPGGQEIKEEPKMPLRQKVSKKATSHVCSLNFQPSRFVLMFPIRYEENCCPYFYLGISLIQLIHNKNYEQNCV